MKQLALVFRTDDGSTYVGMFDEEGDIEVFAPFTSDRSFDILNLDTFGVCEYTESGESDFALKLLGQIQVKIIGEGDEEPTAKGFVEDPAREADAFQNLYEFVLQQFDGEIALSEYQQSGSKTLH